LLGRVFHEGDDELDVGVELEGGGEGLVEGGIGLEAGDLFGGEVLLGVELDLFEQGCKCASFHGRQAGWEDGRGRADDVVQLLDI
jgi:hypothetical protein